MQLFLVLFSHGFGLVAAVLHRAREQPPPPLQTEANLPRVRAQRFPPEQVLSQQKSLYPKPEEWKVKSDKRKVCLSIAAYEESEWIDALLDNARKFTEPTTKIALHLDSKAEYDEARLRGWNSEKVVIGEERVSTQAFHGGVLYSHLLNAKALHKKWPHECAYFVMGASNMMWVRRGMEAYVREHEMIALTNTSCNFNPYICDHPVVNDMTGGDHSMVAWSQPEGLFMPMWIVSEFAQYLDDWVKTNHWNMTEQIVLERGHFEEYWLQTWAHNKHQDIVYAHSRRGETKSSPLSFRMLGDGVTMEQVRAVMTGERDQFAVKRVNRDFNFPTTRYIISLP